MQRHHLHDGDVAAPLADRLLALVVAGDVCEEEARLLGHLRARRVAVNTEAEGSRSTLTRPACASVTWFASSLIASLSASIFASCWQIVSVTWSQGEIWGDMGEIWGDMGRYD